MADDIRLNFQEDKERGVVIARIEGNLMKAAGRSAIFTIHSTVNVHDSRGVDSSKEIYRREFVINAGGNSIEIPAHSLNAYSYSGRMINISLRGILKIDDAFIWDTTVYEDIALKLVKQPVVDDDAKELIEPKDIFDLMANVEAIPYRARVMVMILGIAGLVVIAVNTLIGVHDQFVPEQATYFYSHVDSDGDSSSPLFNSLGLSGAAGAALWLGIRRQLRKYMQFRLKPLPGVVDRKQIFRIADLVEGSARVELRDVTLRIVACNIEKGQYKRGSGTKERTVSFSEPIRGVLLYSQQVELIPRRVEVSQYFDGDVSFEPMFAILYPPQKISSSHGMEVYWEVQLIHNEFVDQELKGPTSVFRTRDFMTGRERA